jgi:hypothetical protein
VTIQSSADMPHSFQTIAKETQTAMQKMLRRKRPSDARKSCQDYADKAFETRRFAVRGCRPGPSLSGGRVLV